MIIQCGKCGTEYRFDETLMAGEGAWVRCTRCRNVFFQENPSGTGPYEAGEKRDDDSAGYAPAVIKAEKPLDENGEVKKGGLSTSKKVLIAFVILLVAAVGLFFWYLPQTARKVLETLPGGEVVADGLGIEKSRSKVQGGIDFLDVRENFVKNWLIGDIMVIHGTAANRFSHPVSKIRIRGKLLDSQGRFVGETESYCGNFFTDDDLAKMTEKEIREKVVTPQGRDIPASGLAPGGKAPFVLVFTRPPGNAAEYIVEMVSVAGPVKK